MEKQAEGNNNKLVRVFYALVTLAVVGVIAFFVYQNTTTETNYPFKLGLDLAGGSQLIYVADVSGIEPGEVNDLMSVLREVIERRINVFGVSEPNIQVEQSSFAAAEAEHRIIVELPGVTDISEAISEIGRTPLLEFKLLDPAALAEAVAIEAVDAEGNPITIGAGDEPVDPYIDTGLTGRYLQSAQLQFAGAGAGLSNEPIVAISFNDEGGALFAEITGNNIGKQLAIFLDGEVISSPRINERIQGGQAVISGGFTPTEARDLAQNLNFGALPVPIEIDSTNTIGSTLGDVALQSGIFAGVVGLIILSAFMTLWYRLPGVVAVTALAAYIVIMLALFQLIPVVLTAAGIAGLILSIGMAVDANILIAERIKEEIRAGKPAEEAVREGFARAWLAIRDSNITSIVVAIILFWFGTALIKGFALVFGIGVLVSMLSAIIISRTFLLAILVDTSKPLGRFLMSSGFSR